MNQSKYKYKNKQFRNNIRRQQLEHRKRQFRVSAEIDLTNNNDLAYFMKLAILPSPKEYTLDQILQAKLQILQEPPILQHKIVQQTQEFLNIQSHIRFWKYYSQHLYHDESLYTGKIKLILLTLIKKYSYQELHYNTTYEFYILNTLEQASKYMSKSQKDIVLDWISGAQGLRVIYSCIDETQFMKYSEYRRMYKVIELGLKSQLKAQAEEAAFVLNKILAYSDWDDTAELYHNAHGLMVFLCSKIQRYYKTEQVNKYSEGIFLLLDSYEEIVVDYARSGVAYTASLMLNSQIQSNIVDGLTILRIMTQIQNTKLLILLLESKDIIEAKLWQNLFQSSIYSQSGNIKLRQAFFSFLNNILTTGTQDIINQINLKCSEHYEDLFELLAECLRDETIPLIINLAIKSIESIIYYGQRQNQDNYLLPILEARNIIKYLTNLEGHQSTEISEYSSKILSLLHKN